MVIPTPTPLIVAIVCGPIALPRVATLLKKVDKSPGLLPRSDLGSPPFELLAKPSKLGNKSSSTSMPVTKSKPLKIMSILLGACHNDCVDILTFP
jgi:hypothetical protein